MYTLLGYQYKDYVSKTSGKQVVGVNLFFSYPSRAKDFQGQEVLTEFARPEVTNGVDLQLGNQYELLYGRGFGGKAVLVGVREV